MSLQDTIRRLADQLDTDAEPVRYAPGVVTSVTAGSTADGSTPLTVQVLGAAPLQMPYLQQSTAWSSGDVGQLVAVLLHKGSPIVLGRIVGSPS